MKVVVGEGITNLERRNRIERKTRLSLSLSRSTLSLYHHLFSLFTALIVASCASITTSPGRPLTRRSALAALLDFAKRERPKAISSEKPKRELRKPVQFFSEREKKAEKNSCLFV